MVALTAPSSTKLVGKLPRPLWALRSSYATRTPLELLPWCNCPLKGLTLSSKALSVTILSQVCRSLSKRTTTAVFRHAAEPLFGVDHVDAHCRMDAIYPGCFTSPAFLNALLYSVVQTANKGMTTLDGLRLLGKALQSLGQSISSKGGLHPAEFGAIMILQGVAYRWNDSASHKAHTNGLGLLMDRPGMKEECLTTRGTRAMFWFGAATSINVNLANIAVGRISSRLC